MYIADLHIHSKYSRATSRDCTPEHLDLWARRKGIRLVGTGDFTHPAWREELKEKLVPAEQGLYTLKPEYRMEESGAIPVQAPRFVLSGEISSIYKKNGRVRKVHNVILLPGLREAEELSRKLEAIGNIHSDGRPILGLDSHDLLELTLETCPEAIFIPAHIWTPHFSLFGAFSGFDTIEECFEDLTPHIHALETGLSSDPPMNWRLSALDRYTLVSNSDAHSPAKLGREANLIDAELSYPGLAAALAGGQKAGFAGTIEFFPEEGKYHLDGHRNCKLCLTPAETEKYGGKCPVCGKKITIGVQHRVEQLADRAEGYLPPHAARFESLVPLPEVIGASTGRAAAGVRVQRQYESMLRALGDEFSILRQISPSDIERVAGPCVAEGIRRLRAGRVQRIAGYDGEYGKIQLLDPAEIEALNGQTCLISFGAAAAKKRAAPRKKAAKKADRETDGTTQQLSFEQASSIQPAESLNEEQRAAVTAPEREVAVIAGPGTGKTKTLVSRIAHLVESCGADPGRITAVTFTNKAAAEMRERLEARLGGPEKVKRMTIGTFHSICLRQLSERDRPVLLADEAQALETAGEAVKELSVKKSPRQLLQEVSRRKSGLPQEELPEELYEAYCGRLSRRGLIDFDDLLLQGLALCKEEGSGRSSDYLLVDEFQDINPVQFELVRAWSGEGKSLFVIGDPDQSIYGFRGSDAHCFERLAADCPDLRVIRLVKNYRSTPQILACALPMISRSDGIDRELEAQGENGLPVELVTAESDLSEGIFIAKEINRMVGGIDMLDAQALLGGEGGQPREFGDIALLYRTHRQAAVLETCLRREGIPYTVSGRDDFLQDDSVRGAVCFFRSLSDFRDLPSLCDCLRLVWSCPPEVIEQFAAAAEQEEGVLADPFIESAASRFPGESGVAQWARLAAELFPRMHTDTPAQLLQRFAQETGNAGSEPLQRLINTAVFHQRLEPFLQALLLGQESDLVRSSGKEYSSGAVSLMTLHGSKGLEFPVVFLCGVKKGGIPLETPGRPADAEEERRLFYVGMTRAKEQLLVMTSSEHSCLIGDIPAGLLHKRDAVSRRAAAQGTQLSLF